MKFNPQLTKMLAGASTKPEWVTGIISGLGAPSPRRLRCFHSPTVTDDPFKDGVEFLNVELSGPMIDIGGDIANLGIIGASTINKPADLSVGSAVLRIYGNGNYAEATLGLAGSDAEYVMSDILTGNASTGLAFTNNSGVRSPTMLGTGIGPPPPAIDLSAPAKVRLKDYTDENNPITVKTIAFNDRIENITMDDIEIADSMGDVRVTLSTETMVLGQIEFGVILLSMGPQANAEVYAPVHQVGINMRVFGTPWAAHYPLRTGYSETVDVTHAPPFKIELLNGRDEVIHIFQQRDNLPVNSPKMAQFRDNTNALRPHTSCAQIIPYQSHEIKINKKARKIFNGMMPDILRNSTCRVPGSSNAWIPLGSDSQYNQALHYFAAPQWPMPQGVQNANDYPNAVDPMLYDIDAASGNSINQHARTSGWDWEIGSISGHDRYSGPGGIRPERCVYPPALTMYLTNPDGVRPKGNVLYKAMMKAWNFGYFNQSRHFFKNVRTWESLPIADVFKNRFSHSLSYYGPNASGYALDPADHLPLFARPNQSSKIYRNADGHRPYNGDAVDFMHAYSMSGWGALINNSPLHLISHKHYVISNILAWFGGGMSSNPNVLSRFHSRQDAWHWLAMTMAWKLSSNHPLGIPRGVVEARMQYYLDAIYNSVYLPSLTSDEPAFKCIRAFGTPGDDNVDGSTHFIRSWNSSMAYYMAGVFHMMKTTGAWDMLWNKSEQNRTTLRFWIECYDKYSIDFVLDTDIRYDYYMPLTVPVPIGEPNAEIPSSWADWATKVKPKTGVEDWITNPDGSHRNERDGNTHLRAQYAFMRRDFDLYVPNPRIIAACNKYQGYYDTMEQRVNQRVGAYDKRNLDWNVRWPGNGIIKPSEV